MYAGALTALVKRAEALSVNDKIPPMRKVALLDAYSELQNEFERGARGET